MTTAAVYARFSSSTQHEESIDIQVEQCRALIEREGWEQGEVYTDYAMTGTNDQRPGFQRCIADGMDGKFEILVIYKLDRFARNVEITERYRKMLAVGGVRIVSVREGAYDDTPEGFLMNLINSGMAEYYSRNLSVMIRDGNKKRAEQRKACGHRVFGYDVNEDDRFIINPEQAAIVRHVFEAYDSGQSVADIAKWMDEQGVRTKFGNPYSVQAICKMLKNDAYTGVYRFNGVVDKENGMPAIISQQLFVSVNAKMNDRHRAKRGPKMANYLLTTKLSCLKCGAQMGGSSGNNPQGKKYTYYKCRKCGTTVPQDVLEEAIVDELKAIFDDEELVEEIVQYVLEYAASLPDSRESYEKEKTALLKRRGNLIDAMAQGVNPAALKDALNEIQDKMDALDSSMLANEMGKKILSEDAIREWFKKFMRRHDIVEQQAEIIIKTFVTSVYADEDTCIILYSTKGEATTLELEDLQAIKNGEQADESHVRLSNLWWRRGESSRTFCIVGNTIVLKLINYRSDTSRKMR